MSAQITTNAYIREYRNVVRLTSILKLLIAKRKKQAQNAFSRLYFAKFSKLSENDVWNFFDNNVLLAPRTASAIIKNEAIFISFLLF